MRTRSAATAAALALLVLSGCSGPAVTTAESPQPPASAPSASTTARPVGFDETYTFPDGVAVKVSKITQAKLGPFPVTEDPSAKKGDPYIITTITLTNNTTAQVELLPLVVMRFGPDSRQAARVDVGEYADQLNLERKESADYSFGNIVPTEFRTEVMLEVTLSSDPVRTVIFAGSIA
jgi:hypothetical protein